MNEKTNKKEWQLTIAPELLEAWKKLKRKKDPEAMAEKLGYSRPVIDRALIYGYVSMPDLIEKINTFFLERMNKEKEAARELVDAYKEINPEK